MGTRRWTIPWALALLAATGASAQAQAQAPVYVPAPPYVPTPEYARDLARAGHEKKLAGLTLIVGGGALVATGIGLTIAGFASDDPTRCSHSGGFYYYAYRSDGTGGSGAYNGGGDVSCWNQALVLAGGSTWLLGAAALGIGIPVYVIGRRQARDAERLLRFFRHDR